MLEARDRIMVALDCGREEALELAQKLNGHARWVKVGMTLYYACGPEIVAAMRELGMHVFVDLKLHDIPHQVRGAAESVARAGADILTIHALGGSKMVAAAREGVEAAAEARGGERPRLIAVTVLTSMDDAALAEVGVARTPAEEVRALAAMVQANGADGIVCSPQEAAAMRELLGPEALIVTPGVRPAGAALGDQSRVATPAAAVAAGASMLVIGRPITEADDPVAAFEAIVDELEA